MAEITARKIVKVIHWVVRHIAASVSPSPIHALTTAKSMIITSTMSIRSMTSMATLHHTSTNLSNVFHECLLNYARGRRSYIGLHDIDGGGWRGLYFDNRWVLGHLFCIAGRGSLLLK